MSKIRKRSAVIMALVLVMCVGYFSLMSTTSAWFYNSGVIDSGDTFIFGDLSVDTSFNSKSKVVFNGATKFADKDEVLFDKVVNVEEISVYNSGTIPARIYADAVNTGSGEGFRWFFFSDAQVVDGSNLNELGIIFQVIEGVASGREINGKSTGQALAVG